MNTHTRRTLAIGVSTAVVVYALAGFLIAPLIISQRVTSALTQQTGREADIGRVQFNPFTLTATLTDLTLGQPPDAAAASVRRITARLNLTDLFARGWNARELTFTAPQLTLPAHVDWWDSWLASWAVAADLDVGAVTVQEGVLEILAGGHSVIHFDALRLSLHNLSSTADHAADFSLSAAVGDGGGLTLAGSLALSSAALDATLIVQDIDLGRFGFRLGPEAEFVLSSAVMAAQTQVNNRGNNTTFFGDVHLQQVAVVDADSADVFTALAVSAKALKLRLTPLEMVAASVRLHAPKLRLGRDGNGAAFGDDWLRLFAPGVAGVLVASDTIEIVDGRIELTDAAVNPAVNLQMTDVHGRIAHEDPLASATLSIVGSLTPDSTTRLDANWEPAGAKQAGAWQLRVQALDATVLSPYLQAVADHAIEGGTLNLMLERKLMGTVDAYDYEIVGSKMQLLKLDQQEGSPAWPLGLALALLEDGDGTARAGVTVPPHPGVDSTQLTARLRAALADYVSAIVLSPFAQLAQLAGVPRENLAQVEFDSGSAALTTAASDRLRTLAAALSQRPGLGIEATGHYDPAADRDALAGQQMRQHIVLASGVGDRARAARTAVDFADAKVISIIEEFAGKRLHNVAVTAIAARHPEAGPDYYAALFEALADNETVSRRALNNLARFRARTVVGELVAAGIARERLTVSRNVETDSQSDATTFVKLRATSSLVQNDLNDSQKTLTNPGR